VPLYTVPALASVVVVVAVELLWLRTGLFRRAAFWIAYAICAAFQVLVDGWLTKLSAPIVLYAEEEFSGWRFPWDIPVEDFVYGFSLIALTLLLWERRRQRDEAAGPDVAGRAVEVPAGAEGVGTRSGTDPSGPGEERR
jgi:lycopene cyclase domain-containing protein